MEEATCLKQALDEVEYTTWHKVKEMVLCIFVGPAIGPPTMQIYMRRRCTVASFLVFLIPLDISVC